MCVPGWCLLLLKMVLICCVILFTNFFLSFSLSLIHIDCVSVTLCVWIFRMLKIYRKIHKFCALMEYFSANDFKFDNDNVRALCGKLESTDKQLFAFDMRNLNWTELFQLSLLGVRQYVVKDDPSTIPESIKRHERYGYCFVVVFISFVFLFQFFFFCHFQWWWWWRWRYWFEW